LQVSDFYYELPPELIAQEPLSERAASRMLVISRAQRSFHDDVFKNLPGYIRAGDCLVLNNTRVIPARLHGRRNSESGAQVEILLVRALDHQEISWNVLARPAKRVRASDQLIFGPGFIADVLAEGDFGERTIRFRPDKPVQQMLDELGRTPLPPYIHRQPEARDRERYQTVFAERRGSAAAPTAGLHFTPESLQQCRAAGAGIAYITLHVGLGTFAPVRAKELSDIRLHEEHFEIAAADAAVIRDAARRLCVGTTSVRALETSMQNGPVAAAQGDTSLFIQPGFRFAGTDALLTNFHLPESTLLMLVCAFAGRDLTLAAYRHAVRERYRFFSYGDCMLIE
jgi:S-adenosylmethionine:tRNA ribosyltransferase-isomerase